MLTKTAYRFLFIGGAACFTLAACATYEPLPLADKPALATGLPSTVDSTKPLTMADITRLTLELNPDLKNARNDKDVAQAPLTANEPLVGVALILQALAEKVASLGLEVVFEPTSL